MTTICAYIVILKLNSKRAHTHTHKPGLYDKTSARWPVKVYWSTGVINGAVCSPFSQQYTCIRAVLFIQATAEKCKIGKPYYIFEETKTIIRFDTTLLFVYVYHFNVTHLKRTPVTGIITHIVYCSCPYTRSATGEDQGRRCI